MAVNKTLNIGKFRQKFQHVFNKDINNFYPMHMAKGMVQLQKTLKSVDCIVEVHDARIPFSGRNAKFQENLMVRPHLLLLNKIDLASKEHHKKIETILHNQGIQKVLYSCCKENMDDTIKNKLLPSVLEMIESSDRFHRTDGVDFNVLIIGIPNVGKSSLINALRNMHLRKGGKATPVGATPGITRSVMEKIKVCESPKVYVFDSPGILPPSIPNMDVAMKLALCASFKEKLIGLSTVVDYLLFLLNKYGLFTYVKHYNLEEPTDDVFYLLTHVCKQHNLIKKLKSTSGEYVFRPNFDHAAEIILKDFREARLGKVNLDIDILLSQDSQGNSKSDRNCT